MSVVITNHDCERFLSDAIESALAQAHTDTEVIVVDDGSTDASSAVIARFADRVRVLMEQHGGQGAAVNAGFRVSTGDAVIFLDPDDVLLPDAATEAAAALAEPGVVKAQWPMLIADEQGRATGELYPALPLDDGDLRERLWTCPRYTTPPQSGNAYSRRCLEQILPMPEEPFPAGADCYLYHLVIPFGTVRTIAQPLSLYRRHGASVSAQPVRERMARWAGLDDAAWRSLAEAARRVGLPADADTWRRNSWNHRLLGAADDIERLVPPGVPFVLIDDNGSLGLPEEDVRRAARWWGAPADGAAAVAELEQHLADGRRYAVLAWPAFWWLAYYRDLQEHLAGRALLVANERVRIYDLAAARVGRGAHAGDADQPVPVVLCAGGRPDRLARSLAMLEEQDGRRVEVHVVDRQDDVDGLGALRMAAELRDRFPRVVFLADDVDLAPNALATLLAEHRPGTLGAHDAFRLLSRGERLVQRPCPAGARADLCRAGAIVCDAELLGDPDLLACPEHGRELWDLWLSHLASRRGWRIYRSAADVHRHAPARPADVGERESRLIRELIARGWAVGATEADPPQQPPRRRNAVRRRVAVFREDFLPRSETFVREHLLHLPTWTPIALTTGRVDGGLEVPGVQVAEVAGRSDRRSRDIALSALLRHLDVDVVHAHFGPDAAVVREAARRLDLPLVATFHGYDATVEPELLRAWPSGAQLVEEWDALMGDLAALITVSGFLRDELVRRGADPRRIVVIPCGVDTAALPWSPPPRDGGLLFVGRLVEKKGCADLLDAVAMLPARPRLRIVGDGPLRAELEERADALGLVPEFLGALDSRMVRHAMEQASIVVMPSRRARNGDCEGLPVVSLEASALGRPVVGYRHSGLVESVVSGESGVLVAEGDVEALAAALESLLDDHTELERFSHNARTHVERNFELRDCLRRVEDVYEAVTRAPMRVETPEFASADPDHSRWLAERVWAGEYDEPGFVPQDGWRVIDVGANVGTFSVLAAARGAKVVAYEPHPETFRYLEQNAAPRGVECRRAAVVAALPASGHVSLFLGDKDTRHSLLPADQADEVALVEHVDVPAVSVRDVVSGGCELLKLDCEGVEFDLLDSLFPEDLQGVRRLVAELHGSREQMDAFERRLQAEGYRTLRRPLEHERLSMLYGTRDAAVR